MNIIFEKLFILFLVYIIPGFLLILFSKKINKIDFINIILNSFIFNSILIISLFLKTLLNLDFINYKFLILISFLISLFATKKLLIERNYLDNIFLIIFFLFGFYILFPLLTLEVPPLHDGIANSYFSKLFLEYEFNNYPKAIGFYQPGASIFIAYLSLLTKTITPKITNELTLFSIIFFNSLFPIFIKKIFIYTEKNINKKSEILILITTYLLSFFIIKWHLSNFLIGSKNSLLISTNFFLVYLYLFIIILGKKLLNLLNIINLIVVALAAFFTHYTMFFLILPTIFLIPNFIDINLKNIKKILNKKLFFYLILFTQLIIFITYFIVSKNNTIKDLIRSEIITISNFSMKEIYSHLIFRIINSQGDLYKFIFIFSLIILFIKFITKKINLIDKILFIYLVFLVIYFYTPIHLIKVFTIEYNFGFIVLLVSVYFIFNLIKESKILTISFLIWLILLSYYSFRRIVNIDINNIKKYVLISEQDKNAFKWIEKNIDHNDYLFPLQYKYVGNLNRIFDLSPVAYLKVFTNRNSCPAFIDSEIDPNCSSKIIPILKKYNNNLLDENLLQMLYKNKIKYFYISKQDPFGDGIIEIEKILKSNKFKKIYSNNFVTILVFNN